jgi:hypothetical protein
MTSVSQNRSGIASAVNNAVARLAGLLVVAFLGIFVAYQTTHSINSSPLHLSTDAKSLTTQAVAEGLKSTSLLHLSTEEQAHIPMIVSTAQRGIYVDSILLNSILAFSAGIIALFTIQSKRN